MERVEQARIHHERIGPADTFTERGVVRPILHDGAPILQQPSTPVDQDDPTIAKDMADLAATLADFRASAGFGRAISAPQIGVGKRLIMMNLGQGPMAIINPEIVWRSDSLQWVWDDCLSVPDLLVRVERAAAVTVEFSDHLGRRFRWPKLPEDLSELLQHEIDHLDGILMTDRAGPGAERVPMSARATVIGGAKSASTEPPAPIGLTS